VGAALGAARLARLAVTGESISEVCLAPPTLESCEPDRAQAPLLAHRLARYRSIYQALKAGFAEQA
jgi:xylulokinase